jgi:hypothetical protein
LSEQVTIKSVRDGKKIELSWPDPRESFASHIKVRVVGLGVDVSADVDLYTSEPLPKFFENLANSWTGWEGERRWTSLEEELKLSASIDRTGHVTIRVGLMSGHHMYAWRLETAVELESGQLEALAKDMALFFANKKT